MIKWKYEVKGWGAVIQSDDDDYVAKRDKLVALLKKSWWYISTREDGDLADLVDELAETEDVDEMDEVLDRIYDLADDDRAWLDPSWD